MANKGICDARCQAFHVAMIKREEAGRIRWFLKNQQKLLDRLKITEPVKTVEPSTPETEKQPSIIHLKPLPNWRPTEPDGSIDMSIMKPIDPQIRDILYQHAPSFINRENYFYKRYSTVIQKSINRLLVAAALSNGICCCLDVFIDYDRLKDMPEKRFYYPECTSWLHGWRYSDYPPVPRSRVGHTNVMIREFYHPKISSLQREPDWYQPCLRTPSTCDS